MSVLASNLVCAGTNLSVTNVPADVRLFVGCKVHYTWLAKDYQGHVKNKNYYKTSNRPPPLIERHLNGEVVK